MSAGGSEALTLMSEGVPATFGSNDPRRLEVHVKALYAWLAGLSRNTRRAYMAAWRDFFVFAGWPAPESVSAADIARWKLHLKSEGRRDSTIYARLSALSSYFDYISRPVGASESGLVQWNPVRGVGRSDLGYAAIPKAMRWRAFEQILASLPDGALGKRDRAILLFFAYTGRRRSEVASLRLRNFHFGAPDDPERWYECVVKGGDVARWELPEICYHAIVEYLSAWGRANDLRPEDGLFLSRQVRPGSEYEPMSANGLSGVLLRAAKQAGYPDVSLHQLRHMAAHDLEESGLDPRKIQAFLGHTSLATTETYLGRLTGVRPSFEEHLKRTRDGRPPAG